MKTRWTWIFSLSALVMLLGVTAAGPVSAEHVTPVDCSNSESIQAAVEACFEKLPCEADYQVISICRSEKQYCGCSPRRQSARNDRERARWFTQTQIPDATGPAKIDPSQGNP